MPTHSLLLWVCICPRLNVYDSRLTARIITTFNLWQIHTYNNSSFYGIHIQQLNNLLLYVELSMSIFWKSGEFVVWTLSIFYHSCQYSIPLVNILSLLSIFHPYCHYTVRVDNMSWIVCFHFLFGICLFCRVWRKSTFITRYGNLWFWPGWVKSPRASPSDSLLTTVRILDYHT